ncbi:unnamed protein product [Moneuplotes crassus]|uniref:C2HC/C3H-type domain-containing protein n=1 Tax=Euplotes crassus TaxID=5936 RepID=A0AAD1Y3P0_EUPCR|nr:unnamed protein product [Moneuplotes crassus]
MNINSATTETDLVLTCYICDDQYTGDRIESHVRDCEKDWNYEELEKPVNERIPLPKPTKEFLTDFQRATDLHHSKLSVIGGLNDKTFTVTPSSSRNTDKNNNHLEVLSSPLRLSHDNSDGNIESSLAACPICSRTFFPERLGIHLKSCKKVPSSVKTKNLWNKISEKSKQWLKNKPGKNNGIKIKIHSSIRNRKKRKVVKKPTTDEKFKLSGVKISGKASHKSSSKSFSKSALERPKPYPDAHISTPSALSKTDEDSKQQVAEFQEIYGSPEQEDNRVACSTCGRKFNLDRLPIHLKSCSNMKKRAVFNSQKKRVVDGSMGIPTMKKKATPKNKVNKGNLTEKKAKWKRDHEDLVNAIKMSRMIKKVQEEGGDITKIPVAPPSQNDDYVECRYCYRRYAPAVAERHIPKCKDMINRPKPPPHILKRLKEEEGMRKRKLRIRKLRTNNHHKDKKNMTASNFSKELKPEARSTILNTHYPFKPTLKKIKEVNEDNDHQEVSHKKPPLHLDFHPKRGKHFAKAMNSNGFSRSGINNSTSYQTNFNDVALSTSSSRNFVQSPHRSSLESRNTAKRANSLIARSATYSSIPCPHCDRKFSTAAAERHIPICNSIIAKPIGLRKALSKRSSVELPHLSQASYKNGGFDKSLIIQTSSTFRSNKGRLHHSQIVGLPPTHNGCSNSAGLGRTKSIFHSKRVFCTCCGMKLRSRDKFCSSCGEKRTNQ